MTTIVTLPGHPQGVLDGRPHDLPLRSDEPGRKHGLSQAACHSPRCTYTRAGEVPLGVFTPVVHKIVCQ